MSYYNGAQEHAAVIVRHLDDVAVSAGGHEAGEGGHEIQKGQIVGGDMAQDMVGVDEGLAGGKGQAFSIAHPHQQSADQTGPAGDGDGVYVGEGQARVSQRRFHHGPHLIHMVAAGQLRHHAAELAVDGYLGVDGVREHLPPVSHHGGGGLVTGGLYG